MTEMSSTGASTDPADAMCHTHLISKALRALNTIVATIVVSHHVGYWAAPASTKGEVHPGVAEI